MANIRGANKGKGNTTTPPVVGTAVSGGVRKVSRPSGYGGRTSTSARGGLTDAALGSNNRGSGGKGGPNTGLNGGGSTGGGGSAGGSIGGGVTASTSTAGGGTKTSSSVTAPATTSVDSVFASALPLSAARQQSMNVSPAPVRAAPPITTKQATKAAAAVGGSTASALTSVIASKAATGISNVAKIAGSILTPVAPPDVAKKVATGINNVAGIAAASGLLGDKGAPKLTEAQKVAAHNAHVAHVGQEAKKKAVAAAAHKAHVAHVAHEAAKNAPAIKKAATAATRKSKKIGASRPGLTGTHPGGGGPQEY